MRPTGGTLSVAGLELPAQARAVRRLAALGIVERVNELSPTRTLGEHLAETALLAGVRLRAPEARALLDRAEVAAGLGTLAGDLGRLDRTLAGVALALVSSPRLVVVDDADRDLTPAQSHALFGVLAELAQDGPTIIAAVSDPAAAAGAVLAATLGPIGDDRVPATLTEEVPAGALA